MLRDTFFRVQSYHPNEPLESGWYGFESDNSFQIFKNTTSKATYSAPSKGIGKTKAVFNTEYFVYENGAGQIKALDEHSHSFVLLTDANIKAFVAFDKSFCTITFDSITGVATAKIYIIVGIPEDPFVQLLTTKTLTLSAAMSAASCKVDTTSAFVGQYYISPAYYSVKITKPDTFTNDESDPANDATFEVVNGSLEEQGIPAESAVVNYTNFLNTFYNPTLKYYMEKSGSVYTIKNLTGTTIAIISGSNCRVFLDDNGDGYITTIGIKTISGSSRLFSQLYSLTGGVQTLIQESNAGANTGNSYNFSSTDGLFPLIENKIPPILAVRSTLLYGFSYTISGISFNNYSGTSKAIATFGCKILWI